MSVYLYDAFGNGLESREVLFNRIRYTGQQYDRETGQYYLRARYYNSHTGRFTQEDTYRGDGLNLYAYCGNNPVVYYDPSGHATKKPACGGGNPNSQDDSEAKRVADDGGSGTLSDTARLDNMTPRELNNLTPEQIKQALPDGWTYSGSPDGRFIHIKDSNGNYRIRIDPPDKTTNYPHMHILDGDGNPLDINENIVSPNSPDGHIPR